MQMFYVVTVAFALILALALHINAESQAQHAVRDVCIDARMKEHLKTIMLEALEEAAKNHTQTMFEVWMRDSRDQPQRARTGMRQALSAYVGAREVIAQWEPKQC